jgi:nitrate/TMAO reductase-like tetraheme cytochrome c subunit
VDASLAVQAKERTSTNRPKGQHKRFRRWSSLTVDLTCPRHRNLLILVMLLLGAVGTVALYGGYRVFQYTESAEFCGTTCHAMNSEFARFRVSPHANVECAHCHVGAGLPYFVRSKIDGLRSLYYVVSNTYERPIQSPVHNLRPARETCEECHTPNSFADNIIKTVVRYDKDEANTPIQSTLILKMGGQREGTGGSEGIHWHVSNPVYYIAADEQRQVILWIGAEQQDGSLRQFYSRDLLTMAQTSFVDEARARGEVRRMDCIDCHNRSAHLIPPPDQMVDSAIQEGLISRDLPYIRVKAVEVLSPTYTSEAAAYAAIDGIAEFYRNGYPEVYGGRQTELADALDQLRAIYEATNFPDMKLNWQTNPDNETHSPFLGCFRCHDGKHVEVDSAGNEVGTASVECNLCHTVPIVGRGADLLVEAPVIVGSAPASHADFAFTVEHRTVTDAEREECYQCHGEAFCSNEACHNLSHPPDMLYTHADEYRKAGEQVCYTCHQDILCSRCHPGGAVASP